MMGMSAFCTAICYSPALIEVTTAARAATQGCWFCGKVLESDQDCSTETLRRLAPKRMSPARAGEKAAGLLIL